MVANGTGFAKVLAKQASVVIDFCNAKQSQIREAGVFSKLRTYASC
jgi:hypothetical protein